MACENFKEEEKLSLVLDLICKEFASGKYQNHQSKFLRKDKITGLQVEARCVCKNHGDSRYE